MSNNNNGHLTLDGHPVIIVTHRESVVEYLHETVPCLKRALVYKRVTGEQIDGAVVIGSLPLHLAWRALLVVDIPLKLTAEDRTRILTLDEVRKRVGKAVAYQVVPQGWQYRTELPTLPKAVTTWLDAQCRAGWLSRT